jgi:hypothetical protein
MNKIVYWLVYAAEEYCLVEICCVFMLLIALVIAITSR